MDRQDKISLIPNVATTKNNKIYIPFNNEEGEIPHNSILYNIVNILI